MRREFLAPPRTELTMGEKKPSRFQRRHPKILGNLGLNGSCVIKPAFVNVNTSNGPILPPKDGYTLHGPVRMIRNKSHHWLPTIASFHPLFPITLNSTANLVPPSRPEAIVLPTALSLSLEDSPRLHVRPGRRPDCLHHKPQHAIPPLQAD